MTIWSFLYAAHPIPKHLLRLFCCESCSFIMILYEGYFIKIGVCKKAWSQKGTGQVGYRWAPVLRRACGCDNDRGILCGIRSQRISGNCLPVKEPGAW